MTSELFDNMLLLSERDGHVTLEARVKSHLAAAPGKLRVELRSRGKTLAGLIDSEVVGKEAWKNAQKLTSESIIRVSGHVCVLDKNHRTNGGISNGDDGVVSSTDGVHSIQVTALEVISRASPGLPDAAELMASDLEERLDNRILEVRHAAAGAVFKLHSGMCQLIVEFLCSHGFHWINTPRIITATVTGDNEFFHLPYFGRDAWLAQSSQHHKQMALSMDMERVFEIGPVFREERKSYTSARHMTEFTVLDIGMVFEDDYHEVAELIESMLVFVIRGLQERRQYSKLLESVKQIYPSAREFRIGLDEHGKVPRITFLEAKRILREELGFNADDKKNFTDEEEAALGQHFRNSPKLGQTDIFTIDQFPASMRQFNSQANPERPELSNTWDTIVGGREICSGSQRINDYEQLCDAMRNNVCGPPMDPCAEQWKAYLTAFQTGMPRHGGCGLGVNRLLQSILGLKDIREVTLFPRDANRLAP